MPLLKKEISVRWGLLFIAFSFLSFGALCWYGGRKYREHQEADYGFSDTTAQYRHFSIKQENKIQNDPEKKDKSEIHTLDKIDIEVYYQKHKIPQNVFKKFERDEYYIKTVFENDKYLLHLVYDNIKWNYQLVLFANLEKEKQYIDSLSLKMQKYKKPKIEIFETGNHIYALIEVLRSSGTGLSDYTYNAYWFNDEKITELFVVPLENHLNGWGAVVEFEYKLNKDVKIKDGEIIIDGDYEIEYFNGLDRKREELFSDRGAIQIILKNGQVLYKKNKEMATNLDELTFYFKPDKFVKFYNNNISAKLTNKKEWLVELKKKLKDMENIKFISKLIDNKDMP